VGEGQRAWRWRGTGDKVEAADPVGGQRVRIGHEVVVVVVRGERGAATSDGAPESEVLGHGGVGVHHHEEGAEEQLTPFAIVKCDREIKNRYGRLFKSTPLTHGVDCFKIYLAPQWLCHYPWTFWLEQKCPYGNNFHLNIKKSVQ
jgi:hypothetical protein